MSSELSVLQNSILEWILVGKAANNKNSNSSFCGTSTSVRSFNRQTKKCYCTVNVCEIKSSSCWHHIISSSWPEVGQWNIFLEWYYGCGFRVLSLKCLSQIARHLYNQNNGTTYQQNPADLFSGDKSVKKLLTPDLWFQFLKKTVPFWPAEEIRYTVVQHKKDEKLIQCYFQRNSQAF